MALRYTVAIDPGVRGCGVTFGVDKRIVVATYATGEPNTKVHCGSVWRRMAGDVNANLLSWKSCCVCNGLLPDEDRQGLAGELVIELPQVYDPKHQRNGKDKSDPNDLIQLAATVGAIVGTLDLATTVYLPAEWKGQVPKEIMHERARKRLSEIELGAVEKGLPRAGLAHNVWDSVAMFLKHVERW